MYYLMQKSTFSVTFQNFSFATLLRDHTHKSEESKERSPTIADFKIKTTTFNI